MASKGRNKTAMLEMKSGMFKRDKWKPYNVKVSAFYLLYFKDIDNLSRPDGMVLLSNITKVEPHSSKEPTFSFEVHFKNAKTSPSSPWIFNTTSSEDRIDWMETIKPGSAQLLKQMLHSRSSLSSPTPDTATTLSPQSSVNHKPQPIPRKQSAPDTQFKTLPVHKTTTVPQPTQSLPPCPLTSSLEASSSPPKLPENYVEPTNFPTSPLADPTASLPFGLPKHNGRPPPLARRPNHSYSHKPRNHAKLSSRSSSDVSFPDECGQYEIMDPNVEEVPQPVVAQQPVVAPHPVVAQQPVVAPYPVVAPRTGKPKPKPRSRSGRDSLSSAKVVEAPSSPVDDILDDDDGDSYLFLIDNKKPATTAPIPSERKKGSVPSSVAEQLMKSFDREQLGSLIQMLQQVQGQSEKGVEDAWSTDSPDQGPEASLRGSFKRMLSTAPELSSEKMLVVEGNDSDDESYEPRPDWAKAVHQHTTKTGDDDGQLDTLTALQKDALTIFREDLDDLKQIGEGQFGKVFVGILSRGAEKVQVAIKTTKKTTEEKDQKAFLKEMTIMSQLMHPNIVRLYGLVQNDVPAPWIVLEYLCNGDLKSFLSKNKRPLTKLVKYMVDVSMGMHYISERGLVHRDLAARNVLVSENETCKVADFGLLREVPKDDSFYHMQTNVPCPVRWMPPESVTDRNFSTASDVWSFGILIWEMFNPTKTPYTNSSNIEVATKVMRGYRLPIPRSCPPVIARIMKSCWQENPKKRPSFLLVSTLLTTQVSFPPETAD